MSGTPCCIQCFTGLRQCFAPASIRKKPDIHSTYFQSFVARKRPLRVCLTGVGGPLGYALLPMIANGALFGPEQPVVLLGYDVDTEEMRENMRSIRMELEDGCYPLVQGLRFTFDVNMALRDCDYGILLEGCPRRADMKRQEVMERNIRMFRQIGEVKCLPRLFLGD